MGKIKNLEAKKKAAHVFSSGGGGGGTKGPAIIDKRNMEQECPHCDRTFKQVQRLREHIQKKHPEEDMDGGSSEQQSQYFAPQPGPSSGPKQANMMDVGAKAGYYTEKSPKMMLLEWCQQQKRPTPRYRTTAAEGDSAGKCKVVLADPKDRNKDIVVFLGAEHQAGVPDDMEQRAAVTALHRVAGDRALHRVLPQAYLPLWQELCTAAEARAEREVRSAAAAEARQAREKLRRQAQARRVHKDVIMSDHQRRMVEGVLRGLSADPALLKGPAADSEVLVGEAAEKLRALGFDCADVDDALAVSVAQHGRPSLEAALDWLCVNIPEEDLPPVFAAGASGKTVGVLHNVHAAANGPKEQQAANGLLLDFTELGYAIDEAAAALQSCNGDADLAHARLFDRLTGTEIETSASDAGAADLAVWEEERVALEAIYDGDVLFPSEQQTLLSVDADGTRLTLDFRIRPGGAYPDDLPMIGVRCAELAPGVRLELARRLHGVAEGARSAPMLYEVASAAPALLEDTLRSPAPLIRPSSQQLPALVDTLTLTGPDQNRLEVNAGSASAASQCNGRSKRGGPRKQQQVDSPAESRRLKALREEWFRSAKMQDFRAQRERLPAHAKRAQVLEALQQHRVLIISGATGCGKSTQLPQYILEQATEEGWGGSCNIVVTQPRRISAVGVASRVAAERGEAIGDVVGYSVRLDTRASRRTRLLFCTTGVLLRRLLGDPALQGTTHVVVDEVHERSADSDLLLLLLRDLLAAGANQQLRVVLMSATAEAGLFQTYFDAELARGQSACGLVSIPGFTHPVQDFFLEDVLERTGFVIGRGSKWAKKGKAEAPAGSKKTAATRPAATVPKHEEVTTAWDADDQEKPAVQRGGSNGTTLLSGARQEEAPQYSAATLRSLGNVDESLINYDLLEALMCHVMATQQPSSGASAILVFLPGAPEISRLVRQLQGSSSLRTAASGQTLRILPLHGSLPPDQQSRVFQKVGAGVRKIVVATNVAETSITIDDVVCVIDCGRVKEIRYDAERSISRLQEMWESAASAQQRRGRAGRVRPGVCFHLFSRKQAATFQAQQQPEVLRMPLESLCLSVKAALPGAQRLQTALGRLISPPQPDAVAAAVASLTHLGALDADDEALTALGRHLTLMPMDARLAKTLIYAVMLRCVGPVLTVVAAMAHGRPAFQSPPDRREEAEAARARLTADSAAARSDHLALVAAFSAWSHARSKDGRQAAYQWAAESFVSDAVMEATLQGRAEYAAILADLGFLPPSHAAAYANGNADAQNAHYDEYSGNARVIKAAICAGFYPSILRVDHPPAVFKQVLGGAMEHDASPVRIKFFDRIKGRVFIHPASVNFSCSSFPSGWLLYTDVTETSKVFVREASMVPVYALLLFGGALTVHHADCLIRMDGWATFKAPAQIAALVNGLRKEISQLLLKKIEEPTFDLSASQVVGAVLKLLVHDGF